MLSERNEHFGQHDTDGVLLSGKWVSHIAANGWTHPTDHDLWQAKTRGSLRVLTYRKPYP